MNIPKIEGLSQAQLKKLHLQIERKIYDFWDVIDELNKLQTEEVALRTYIQKRIQKAKAKSEKIKEIEDLGFKIVLYGGENIGIVNYSMPIIGDSYYSFSYDKESGKLTWRDTNPPSDEDIQKIKEILEIT